MPEKWDDISKGYYKISNLPIVNENVILVKGMFHDTLIPFLNEHSGKAAYIHMDACLYSATKYVDTLR